MIKTTSLYFSYDGKVEVLKDIDFELKRGEFLALLGANGSGKSTLLKQLNGLLRPSKGKVFLNERELNTYKEMEVFRKIGMVFQDPNDQLFGANVEQDVAFGPANLGLSPEEVRRRTVEALKMVEALEYIDRPIHSLSYGQKRRVSIAGVLAMQPEAILLDEPTSSLDPQGVSKIMHLLQKLNREQGIAMIMATHDVELVPLFCDRVLIMHRGTIIQQGKPWEVFAAPQLIREAHLRLPRISHLIEIMRNKDELAFNSLPLTIGEARRALLDLFNSHKTANGVYSRISSGESSDSNETGPVK